MATVNAFIRVSTKKNNKVNIRFRLRDGRNLQLFHTSEITILSSDWDAKSQTVKAKIIYDPEERLKLNQSVNNRKNLILYQTAIKVHP